MDLITTLKTNKNISISNIKSHYTLEESAKILNEIIMSSTENAELQKNYIFKINFLKVVSFIYLVEQSTLDQYKKEKTLSTNLFSKEFIEKLEKINRTDEDSTTVFI